MTTAEPFNVVPFVFLLWASLAAGFGVGWLLNRTRPWGILAALGWVVVMALTVKPFLILAYLLPTVGAGAVGVIVAHCRRPRSPHANDQTSDVNLVKPDN